MALNTLQFFYRHPLLEKYKWYWRVEPDVHFRCDIDFDPFLFMEDHNKTYGAWRRFMGGLRGCH